MFRVICAWCKKVLEENPSETDAESHGICKACLEIEMAKLDAEDAEKRDCIPTSDML